MTKCEIMTWTKEGRPNTPVQVNRVGVHNAVGSEGPIQVPLFDETGFNWLHQTMKEHILDGYDFPYVVTGDRRRGKSVFTLKLSQMHDRHFGLDNNHFNIGPFMQGLTDAPSADPDNGIFPTVNFDESITGLNNQEWQSQVPYVQVLNIIGAKRITMGIVLPHIASLNPQVTRLMSVWVYIFERGLAEIRIARTNQFSKDIWWVPYGAIKYGPYPEGDPFWAEYNRRKTDFINDYTESMADNNVIGGRAGLYAHQRNDLIRYIADNKWAQMKDIAERLKVKPNLLSMWLARDKAHPQFPQ